MHKHAAANRFYRLVWSQVHACWVAVAEGTRGQGKSGSVRRAARRLGALAAAGGLAGAALAAPPPNALPSGAQVVAGQVGIAASGQQMTLTQTTPQAIVNWQRFDIGADAAVRFDQPSASAVALNRVVGSDASQIFGKLSSNGSVFLLNPHGVLFGAGAQVDVGALTASSLGLSDRAFLAGKYDFAGASDAGAVRNAGSITAARGGHVALIGPVIANSGSISAPGGSVALAAGEQVSVDLRGDGLVAVRTTRGALQALAENSGLLRADGGQVLLSAMAADALARASVNNRGVVQARGLVADGGSIRLVGDGDVHAGALDASSAAGAGGSITVSGAFVALDGALKADGARGGSIAASAAGNLSAAAAASATGQAGDGGSIRYTAGGGLVENAAARALADGARDGGSVVLAAGAGLSSSGAHSARGAAGAGGRIDMSGAEVNLFSATLDASGQGQGGLVRVGGAFQGGSPQADTPDVARFLTRWGQTAAIANADQVFVNDSSRIDVSARGAAGQGGTAIVWSQQRSTMLGAIDARGAGSGGVAEISSRNELRHVGLDRLALGAGGRLLLDPKNITISADARQWTYQAILGAGRGGGKNVAVDGLEAGDGFGYSVAMNAAGNLLAVGAPFDGGAGAGQNGNPQPGAGAVRLYSFSDGQFSGAALKGTIGSGYTGGGNIDVALGGNAMFGASVALSGDGKTLAVGAPGQWGGSGAVHQFRYANADFSGALSQASLGSHYGSAGVSAGAIAFGSAVALNHDGSKLAAGAVFDDRRANNGGAAYLFANADLGQIASTGVLAEGGGDALYGTALAFNGAGDRLAVGAIGENGGKGAVYLYQTSDNALLRKLSADATAGSNTNVALRDGEYFGSALAFNAAGTRLAVGAPSAPAAGAAALGPGAVRIYDFADTGYAAPKLSAMLGRGYASAPDADIASLKDYDGFGFALALNGAGDRLVVGAPYSDGADGSAGSGSVYGFALQPIPAAGVGFGGAAPASGNATINSDSLAALLGAGASLTLQASNDITLASGSAIDAGAGSGSLTLQAGRSVALNSKVKLGSGSLTVVANEVKLAPGSGPIDADRDAGAATLTVDAELYARAGVTLRMADGAGKTYRENGAITVNAHVHGGRLAIRNLGASAGSDVVLGSAGQLTGEGAGDAIEVVAGASFTNNSSVAVGAGQYGMQAGQGGRILVYADSPASSKPAFSGYNKRYGQAYMGLTPGYAASGNWFFYRQAPLLTVTANSASRVYDGLGTESLNYSVSGLIDGDSAASALSGALRHHADAKNVGRHAIELGSLASQLGYRVQLAPNGAALSITPRALTVNVTGVNKVYDGKSTANVTYTSDALAGDALGFSGNASFADKHVGTGKAISVSAIALTGADAGNYTLNAGSASTSADITPRTLTASASSAGKVYDGLTGAQVTLGDDRVAGDQLALAFSSAGYADKNAGQDKTISVSGITLSGADAANYVLAAPGASTRASITPRTLNVSASGGGKVYDGGLGASVTLADDRLAGDQLNLAASGAAYADKHAGVGKTITVSGLRLDGADAGNYQLASATALSHGDITPRALSARVSGVGKVYDGSAAAKVSYADDRVDGDVLSYSADARYADKHVGAGKAVSVNGIAIGGADAGNYILATTSANTTADITPRTLTASVNAGSKVYDGGTAASVTLGDDRLRGDQLALALADARYADKNAGSGKVVTVSGITLAGADAGNYVLASSSATGSGSITPRTLTFSATGVDKVYDGTALASVRYSDDRLAGDVLSYSGNASFAGKQAGKGLAIGVSGIALGGADALNYTLAATTASATADIRPRTLTVSANGASKVYDGTVAASITLGDDRVGGDQLTLAAGGNAVYADKNAGSGKAVSVGGLTLSGADAANYVLASDTAHGVGSITPKALTVSVSGIDKVYDGKSDAQVSYADSGRVAGDQLSVSGAASFADKNAGAAKLVSVTDMRLGGSDAGNYALVSTGASTRASIAPRVLTATIASAGKVYDGSAAASVTYGDNRVSGDVLTLSGNPARYADKNAGAGKTVSVDGIVLGGGDAANYVLGATSASTRAAITPRALVLSGSAGSKVYDGGTGAGANVSFADNRVTGDALDVRVGGARYADKNVGSNKAVVLEGVSLSGADAANYVVDPASSPITGSITPRTLNVSASGIDKVYDGLATATVNYGDDRVAGDALSIGGKASFADKNAGGGKAVSVSGIVLGGADAGNYTLASTDVGTRASITPRALQVTAQGVAKVYDGQTMASAILSDDRIAGDQLNVTGGSASYADKNAGSGKAISVAGIALAGADARNYVLASASAVGKGDITPRALNVKVSGVDKVYDGGVNASVNFSDDRLGGDTLSYAANASFADKNAGQGKTVNVAGVTLGGADAGNYRLVTATASTSASILRKDLTVRADNRTREVGAANPPFSYVVEGLVAGDSASLVTASASTGATAQSPAGSYAITLSGGDLANYKVAYVDGVLTVVNPAGQLGGTIGAIIQTPVLTPNGTRVHLLDTPSGPGLTPDRLLAGADAGGATANAANGPAPSAAIPNGAPAAPGVPAGAGLTVAAAGISSAMLPGGTRVVARDGGMRTEEE